MKVAFYVCLLILLFHLIDGQQNRNGRRGRPTGRRRPRGRRPTTPAPAVQSSGRCEEIVLPMCRGLVPYTRTMLPNRFGHTTQRDVYRAIEYLWPFMDIGCSRNFRLLVCGLYLPQCPTSGNRALEPCRAVCAKAKKCKARIMELQSEWPQHFRCPALRLKKTNCIKPVRDRASCSYRHVTCARNQHEFCQGLNFPKGTIPNMFLQCKDDIHKELEQYRPLIESGCSEHLSFLLCGVFQPFCDRPENPFALPCQEICEQVKSDCEATYSRLYGNIWWPGKLQCHRYPLSTDRTRVCVMPSDSTIPFPEEDIRRESVDVEEN